MSKPRAMWRSPDKRVDVAAYSGDRDEQVLDAVVSTAALVARADGWVQEVERSQLLVFVDQRDLPFAPEDVLVHFERWVRELREPGGPAAAVQRLGRHGDSTVAALIVDVGTGVAAADCRFDVREEKLLRFIRATLDGATR